MGDAFFFANRQRLVELSLTNRLPLIVSGIREFAVAGALMSYGANASDMFRRSATYVDKIKNQLIGLAHTAHAREIAATSEIDPRHQ
jgi:hypothetical protein